MVTEGRRFIAIEGPIGVGKTTLARKLGEALDARLLLEAPEENPFLGDFYGEPRAYALASQVSFLLQRIRQMRHLHQHELFGQCWVSDFMFEKDRLFAGLTLNAEEMALYDSLSRRLAGSAPVPDRVIYLNAPPPVLMRRVRVRGRAEEQPMEAAYLERVCDAYADFFRAFSRAPVIRVDAAALDLVGSKRDFRRVLDALAHEAGSVNLGSATML